MTRKYKSNDAAAQVAPLVSECLEYLFKQHGVPLSGGLGYPSNSCVTRIFSGGSSTRIVKSVVPLNLNVPNRLIRIYYGLHNMPSDLALALLWKHLSTVSESQKAKLFAERMGVSRSTYNSRVASAYWYLLGMLNSQ